MKRLACAKPSREPDPIGLAPLVKQFRSWCLWPEPELLPHPHKADGVARLQSGLALQSASPAGQARWGRCAARFPCTTFNHALRWASGARAFAVSRSGCHRWRAARPCRRGREDARLTLENPIAAHAEPRHRWASPAERRAASIAPQARASADACRRSARSAAREPASTDHRGGGGNKRGLEDGRCAPPQSGRSLPPSKPSPTVCGSTAPPVTSHRWTSENQTH